jgi:uncharacterized protein YcnI
MSKKIISLVFSFIFLLVLTTSSVYAHTSVKPAEVGVAERVKFTVTSPTERDVPTVGIRLVIPEGLESVSPFTKPGWDVEVKRDGEGEDAKALEIVWSGGEIPVGQRDEFSFNAKVPGEETTLFWKAYQTYSDGFVKAWDQKGEEESEDESVPGPGTETKVVNDLAAEEHKPSVIVNESVDNLAGYAGLLFGLAALGMILVRKP